MTIRFERVRYQFLGIALTGIITLTAVVIPISVTHASAGASSSRLDVNEQLQEGQSLNSGSGRFRAVLQYDGNFVVYDGNHALWANGLNNYFGPNHLVLQGDGNLVSYLNGTPVPLWSTRTNGEDADRLVMQDDGNLVLYNDRDQATWSSKTGKLPPPPPPTPPPSVLSIGESASQSISRDGGYSVPVGSKDLWIFNDTGVFTNTPPAAPRGLDIMNTNGTLQEGQQIVAGGGRIRAVLQHDGNFVVYDGNRALWADGLNNYFGPNHLVLQSDGNLVAYLQNGTPLWSTQTNGQGTTFLAMQGDGNLVLYTTRYVPLWSSQTGRIWQNNADSSWYQSAFIQSSTAAIQATPANAVPTSLNEVGPSTSVPSQFLASPTNLYMPDSSQRACTPQNGANYQARWPNGVALMPNGVDVLITFIDVCVTPTLFRAQAWGFLEYNPSTRTMTQAPTQVFLPNPNGAETPEVGLGSPVIQGDGNLVLFTSACPGRFVTCPGAGSTVSAITITDVSNTANLLDAENYASPVNLAVPTGAQNWRPLILNVVQDIVHGGFLMVEQSSIVGNYQIFHSSSPTGQWTQVADAVMPGCRGLTKGFCYAMIPHPEISSSASTLYVSFFDPQAGPDPNEGHLVMAALPSP
jgi:hypothetical protein